MRLSGLLNLFRPPVDSDNDDDVGRLRAYAMGGSALALIPIAGLMISLAYRGSTVQFVLTGILMICLIVNIYVARSKNFNLWPTRAATFVFILDVVYGTHVNQVLHAVYWALCVPPLLIFGYGRAEGFLWSALLFVPCAIYLFFTATIEIPPAAGLNFVLGFILTSGFALAFQDIYSATNKAAEIRGRALVHEEERFKEFASIASDWLFEFDANNRFTFVSTNLAQLGPTESGDFVGRTVDTLLPILSSGDKTTNRRVANAIADRATLRDERASIEMAGHHYIIDVNMKPIYEGDTYVGYRGVATDVSEIVAGEEELREKDRVLYRSQKMEAVGQLTSGLAHDFNNLLTVIKGNLDLLDADVSDLGGNKQLEAVRTATNRASELTSNLLAFARKQPLQPRSVDSGALIFGMAGMLERTLGEDIEISIEGVNEAASAKLWSLRVDAAQFESAILNLALNARDAMPEGGTLQISVCNEVLQNDGYLSDGDYVRVEVVDSGSGISETIKDLVFDPFFSTKPPGRGSGLGLSMVFGFARQSGGDVRIDNRTGPQTSRGTAIYLLLPRGESVVNEATSVTEPVARQTRNTAKILVVEDDDNVRDLLATMLHAIGHEPAILSSAVAGEAYFDRNPVDLLITDIILADGENGLRMAQKLRVQAPRLPILLISGYAQPIANASFQLDQHMRLLSKPFGLEELELALNDLLAGV